MFLEKNLSALAAKYPMYVELIRSAPHSGRYISQNTPKGLNLFDMKDKVPLYPGANPLYSAHEDIRETVRLANLSVILGLGLGYHIKALLESTPTLDAVLVFEADLELVKAAFIALDFTPYLKNPNIFFCFGNPMLMHPYIYQALMHRDAKYYMKSINFITAGPSYRQNKDYYTACIQAIKQAVGRVLLFFGNDPADSMIGIHHTFVNIDEIIEHPGIKELKNAFKNKPGIVVATGPSLNKNIELLKEVGNRAVIAAADASLKVMLARGLKPHFVNSLERVLPTARLLENLTEVEVEDIYFAPCPVIHPDTYANWPGKKIVVYRDFATFKWLEIDKGLITIGPSAANMSYKILEYMGCDPIILIGQDLGLAGEATHADGTTYGTKQEIFKGTMMVEGNYESQVATNAVWNQFRLHYEQDIAQNPGTVINATEGGAKIHGALLMTLREAIDKYFGKEIPIHGTIKKRLTVPSAAKKERQRADTLKKVQEAINYCDNVNARFAEAVQSASNLFKDKKQDDFLDCESKLKIFAEPQFYRILMHYVQSYLIKSVIELNSIKAAEGRPEDHYEVVGGQYGNLYITMIKLVETMKAEFLALKEHLIAKKG